MRNQITIKETDVINNLNLNTIMSSGLKSADSNQKNTGTDILAAEGGESFVNYIEWLGFNQDPNQIILSSSHHYYYDAEEMANVKSVINLKELNYIKDIKGFLHSIFHILPKRSFFIGRFVDNEKNNGFELRYSRSAYKDRMNSDAIENGIISRIPFLNKVYSLMDSKTYNYLSSATVSSYFRNNGFKVLDITELNGHTFFCAQRLQHQGDN